MYLVFAGNCYYPNGGMHDFKIIKDSIDDAKKWFEDVIIQGYDADDHWCHIVEYNSLNILCRSKWDENKDGTLVLSWEDVTFES